MSHRKTANPSSSKKHQKYKLNFALMTGPTLEPMESRVLLSATILDGLLVIDGTAGGDVITVATGAALGEVVVNGPDIDADTVFTGVTGITINGLEGNDTITVGPDIKNASNKKINVTINGGDDDDTITGGSGNDLIDGGDGVDTIDYSTATQGVNVRLDQGKASKDGLGGKDTLTSIENVIGSDFNDNITGDGNDNVIIGGAGNDKIKDVGGSNTIDGGEGNNNITTGDGDDNITTGTGNDRIKDSGGTNTIDAGDGNNSISTGDGDDDITTGAGNDRIKDSGGTNIIDAGDGNNSISTGDGDDDITTGAGNDSVSSGDGDDVINTGAGKDNIKSGDGDDDIDGGDDDDSIDGGNGDDNIEGGSGNDKLKGSNGFDTLSGGAGNDSIDGGRDDDSIDGGDDDDNIKGSDGDDDISGGSGNDRLDGGRDDDSIDGDDDDDDIRGGDGEDDIDGGEGDDRIRAGRGRDSVHSGNGNDDVRDDDRDDDEYDDDDVEDDDDGHDDEEDDEDHPSGGPNANATEVIFDVNGDATLTGTSLNKNDRDIFRFTAAADGVLTVVSNTTNDNFAKVEVESAGDEQEAETEPNHGVNTFQIALVEGRTYFVKIKSPNTSSAEYVVTLSAGAGTIQEGGGSEDAPPAPADVVDEVEPNDVKATALAFAFPVANVVRLTGTSLNSADKDFFKFTAAANGTLDAHVYTEAGQLANVEIEDQFGSDILEIEQEDGQNQATGQVVAGVTYFIRVRSETGGAAQYLLDLTIS